VVQRKIETGAEQSRKLSQSAQTASEFILGLFNGGKTLTTAELRKACVTAGRGSQMDKALGRLVEAKTLTRRRIRGKKGSRYTLA